MLWATVSEFSANFIRMWGCRCNSASTEVAEFCSITGTAGFCSVVCTPLPLSIAFALAFDEAGTAQPRTQAGQPAAEPAANEGDFTACRQERQETLEGAAVVLPDAHADILPMSQLQCLPRRNKNLRAQFSRSG